MTPNLPLPPTFKKLGFPSRLSFTYKGFTILHA